MHLPYWFGVECQALGAAHEGPPRTGYRRDVGRGYWCARRVYPPRIGLAWNARRWTPPMRAPHGLVTVGIWEGRCADPLQTAPYLSTLVGVECQALNAAHKGTPRTGYRRDVERGY